MNSYTCVEFIYIGHRPLAPHILYIISLVQVNGDDMHDCVRTHEEAVTALKNSGTTVTLVVEHKYKEFQACLQQVQANDVCDKMPPVAVVEGDSVEDIIIHQGEECDQWAVRSCVVCIDF